MWRNCLSVVLAGLMASFAYGEVLFEEDFSTSATLGDGARAQVLAESLDYAYHAEEGGRLRLRDHATGVSYRPDSLPAEGTVYVSFNLRSLNGSVKDKFAGLVFYRDGQEVFGAGNGYTSEQFSFWGPDGNGIAIGEVPTAVDGEVHKIIVRIEMNPDGPEQVRVGLDPACRRPEDRQPDHQWTTWEGEASFDEMRLRCGNADCVWEFDELRIGTDWASVTPADEGPGETIEQLNIEQSMPAKVEKIGAGIVRFRPAGSTEAQMLPSFALERKFPGLGAANPAPELRPQMGVAGGKKYAYLDVAAETDLYGTGEVTGSLLRNGSKIVLFNKDNYGYGKPDQLYQSHPWVLGLRPDGSAFGVIFDTPWMAELDLRSGILFTVPAEAPDFPVIVIDGRDPQEVMVQLANLTGRMPLPPRWALGYQQCRYSYYPDARARQIADTFRAKRIPCDVIWFDIDYMSGFRVFTFDPNHYPDPKATNAYLHAAGFKSVWMIDPGVKRDPGYFVYESGTAADAWVRRASGEVFVGPVWPGDCVFPDFTSPAVRQWWAGLYRDFMAMGIDGVWNDMNEPAVFDDKTGWTMPLDNQHRGGGEVPSGPHAQYHNIYGMQMVKASREGIQRANPDKRPFVLSRANFLGGHRYAATWTGDNKATWEHLKWSIPMSLNLSLSGQPFNGPDIGGFVGNATPELWAHWIAVGAYYPFSRAHTCTDTDSQEPWSFGPETEAAARTALERRYRLMPYLYTLFRQSSMTGLPVMRPVFFADAADLSLRMEDEAFLLGADLLVVPRWAQSPELPGGIWRDLSIDDGGRAADPYQCTLKVRGGSILPLGPVVQSTEAIADPQPLTLVVVPDAMGQAHGTLYEDDGEGYGYNGGEYRFSKFQAWTQDGRLRVRCAEQEGERDLSRRLVSVVVLAKDGVYYGYGDVCGGVSVTLGDTLQNTDLDKEAYRGPQ